MILAVVFANSEGNILIERFHGVPAEERLHWCSFLVKLGSDNLKGVKNEELLVAPHKSVYIVYTVLGDVSIYVVGKDEYDGLTLSEVIFVITSVVKDVCGKPPTERLFLDKYGRICLCLDEIVWKWNTGKCLFLHRLSRLAMDFESSYDISTTADFIHSRNFTRVALQFPDNLLKDSTKVAAALRQRLQSLREIDVTGNGNVTDVALCVMADTTFGSCCVDEVAALHINADCVIHYGQTCFSLTTTLPAFFVFGKASISIADCVESISKYALSSCKPVMVLFGLEYAHSIQHIKLALSEASISSRSELKSEVHFADVPSFFMFPSKDIKNVNGLLEPSTGFTNNGSSNETSGTRYSIGGLAWKLPEEKSMDDFLIFWIGLDNSAFANVVLTFNACEIVRYDATKNRVVTDLSQQRRILKRRYYLVEKAKDANIIGILVGTLGVAGYLHMIHQMKELITRAGKKAYTLVMGRPNPAKLANFPECDVFVYVSCAQTALLDSKEYLAPIITPFEATIAFNRNQWTGSYVMEFRDLMDLPQVEAGNGNQEEARFSFLHGGYVEDIDNHENAKEDREALALVNATEKALQLRDNCSCLMKGNAKSGAEFFAARSYQGLNIDYENAVPEPYFVGRKGRASRYEDEKSRDET